MEYQYNFRKNQTPVSLYIGIAILVIAAIIFLPGITGMFTTSGTTTTVAPTTTVASTTMKAVLGISTEEFLGYEQRLNIGKSFNLEITPEDTGLLHGFFVGDTYAREKINLRGTLEMDKDGLYIRFDNDDIELGTYFDTFSIDSPQKVWFLGKELLLVGKVGGIVTTGEMVDSATLEEDKLTEVAGVPVEATNIDDTNKDARIKVEGDSETIDEGEMRKVNDYYVYVKQVNADTVDIELYEEKDDIRTGDTYDSCWNYFVDSDAFGIKNTCDYKVYDELEINDMTLSLVSNDVGTTLLQGNIVTEEGNVLMKLRLPDKLFKTSDGFEDTIYIKDHDYCLDVNCDNYVNNLYGILVPNETSYRKISYIGKKIRIHEGVGRIVIEFDKENEETPVWIEDTSGSRITDARDDYYSLFGSKFVDVNPGGGSFEIELANSQRTFSLKIGKTATTDETKTLSVGDKVQVGNTEVVLEDVK